eukprot:TRINITY_DN4225_c2_g1_i1.p1 TRINITY_DN4225_c2_g1~~TRINITY_DN4225_c2_g1_i1.p1  ORF type:complete len:491 (+),score=164.66 TRINITY_DN4225_c2_g1_i1:142-1473(+)
MNVGKSTLMNALTESQTSIVDAKPGTTADTKVALMEMHKLGPVRLYDTPGVDEEGLLGEKKREKAWGNLKDTDVAVVVVNPYRPDTLAAARLVLGKLRERSQQQVQQKIFVLFNLFPGGAGAGAGAASGDFNEMLEKAERELGIRKENEEKTSCPTLAVDLATTDAGKRVITWLESHARKFAAAATCLPDRVPLDSDSVVFLNIPMDDETPNARLLRPQSMMQEALLRNYVNTFAYRMDLKKARSKDRAVALVEEKRFRDNIAMLSSASKLKLVVTDSQAIDIVDPWTLDPGTKQEVVPITTFSITMMNYLSQGRLRQFVDGLTRFEQLRKGDRVLICEACNHNRILDDIGTTQIPQKIAKRFGQGTIAIDHAFGREYQSKDLHKYALVLHCGGCMLDQQRMSARLDDLAQSGVPVTNYGLVLSLLRSRRALARVIRPFGLTL